MDHALRDEAYQVGGKGERQKGRGDRSHYRSACIAPAKQEEDADKRAKKTADRDDSRRAGMERLGVEQVDDGLRIGFHKEPHR